ncbi:MFS transporter [Streptomyces sp. NPDC093982]|uniref:MFS transporter n=1 Tax=Streptomyces sp. NPDC093982 TaxID=3155077 RepID=UPI00343CA1E2
MTTADIGYAAGTHVTGACLGALVSGRLRDRYGRKKLFMLTLGIYVVATIATAFSHEAWYFFLARFITGMGIGGEYAAVNSAIDELVPARNRGQVDLAINGSYRVGTAIGSLAALALLNTARLDADRIVEQMEAEVRRQTQQELPEPGEATTVRQRKVIPFAEIARIAMQRYPRRAFLGLALFIGQACLYNAIVFDLGTILSGYFNTGSRSVHGHLRHRQLPRADAPEPAFRHGRPEADERRNLLRRSASWRRGARRLPGAVTPRSRCPQPGFPAVPAVL